MKEDPDIKALSAFACLPNEVAKKIYEDILDEQSSCSVSDFNFMFETLRICATNDENFLFELRDVSHCFRTAIWTINYLSAEDPSQLHFHAAREVLKNHGDGKLEDNDKARDLLARALVKECNALAAQIIPKDILQENTPEDKRSMTFTGRLNPRSDYLIYPIEGKLWLDHFFIQHISKIGDEGEKAAEEFSNCSKEWYKEYLDNKKALKLFRWWVDLDKEPYYCRYLKMLATVLWKDRIEGQFDRSQKQLPALTQSVSRPVSRFLSSRAQIDPAKGTVAYEGKVVAEIATIDPKLMPIVTRGSHNLNTIYHHKLLRFECRSGFEKWAQGSADPRVLRFEGGETEIAERLGIKYKDAPSIIRSLLHAQAYMNFHFDDGSYGNLIVLRQFKSRKTNREEGVEIVMGTQLMPGYTFSTDKRNRLLVPVPELPPFISSSNYHAGQALLQMLIMEELTNNSIDLATLGSIEINDEKWKSFQKQAGLPDSVFKNAITRWLSDGDDGGRFLIQVEKDRFTLGEEYSKEMNFLFFQGRHRKDQQARGLGSAKKKKRLKID